MKYILSYIFILSTLIISCTHNADNSSIKDRILITIVPQRYIVEGLLPDSAICTVLVPTGASPATYDLSASQMKEISTAKAWLQIGNLGFEKQWTKGIGDNNKDIIIYNTSEGVALIKGDEVVHGDHTHEGGIDPHVWMSTNEMKILAKNSASALSEVFPERKDEIAKNLNALLIRIDNTNKIVNASLKNANNKNFMIYHPALTYFARQYDCKQFPMEIDGKSPSAKQLRVLVDEAKAKDISLIFIQEEFDKSNAETLAKETGAKVVSIEILSEKWEESMINIAEQIAK